MTWLRPRVRVLKLSPFHLVGYVLSAYWSAFYQEFTLSRQRSWWMLWLHGSSSQNPSLFNILPVTESLSESAYINQYLLRRVPWGVRGSLSNELFQSREVWSMEARGRWRREWEKEREEEKERDRLRERLSEKQGKWKEGENSTLSFHFSRKKTYNVGASMT